MGEGAAARRGTRERTHERGTVSGEEVGEGDREEAAPRARSATAAARRVRGEEGGPGYRVSLPRQRRGTARVDDGTGRMVVGNRKGNAARCVKPGYANERRRRRGSESETGGEGRASSSFTARCSTIARDPHERERGSAGREGQAG